jgi:hypothetical protein
MVMLLFSAWCASLRCLRGERLQAVSYPVNESFVSEKVPAANILRMFEAVHAHGRYSIGG